MEQQTKENLRLFMDALDQNSKRIFWHFRWHGHTKLHELVELVNAASDMEVLNLINEVINPTAMRFFNRPALEFYEAKIDCVSGKKLLFHWWLSDFTGDKQQSADNGKLLDVFDEEDKIIIVSEISPSLKVSNIAKVEQRHGIVSISLEKIL